MQIPMHTIHGVGVYPEPLHELQTGIISIGVLADMYETTPSRIIWLFRSGSFLHPTHKGYKWDIQTLIEYCCTEKLISFRQLPNYLKALKDQLPHRAAGSNRFKTKDILAFAASIKGEVDDATT